MRFDPEFGRLMALALAICKRDEVAVQQFAAAIAREVANEVEESDFLGSPRSSSAKEKQQDQLEKLLQDRIRGIGALVDAEGMAWLRQQLPA